jgi:hypothetical protein
MRPLVLSYKIQSVLLDFRKKETGKKRVKNGEISGKSRGNLGEISGKKRGNLGEISGKSRGKRDLSQLKSIIQPVRNFKMYKEIAILKELV